MAVFTIEYTYDPALRETVDEVRPRHREFLAGLRDRGVVLASGPYTSGEGASALLVVRADSEEEALAALAADPFATAGVIARRDAREWNPVVGPWD